MAEHTKLPWRAETACWTPWNGAIGILPADEDEDNAIAWTTAGSNEAANAAFIVKSVNSYQAMQDILIDVWFYFSDSDDPKFRKMADAARALIPDPVSSPSGGE